MSRKDKFLKRVNDLGFSLKDVSDWIEIPEKELRLWTQGKKSIPYKRLWKAYEILDIQPDEI